MIPPVDTATAKPQLKPTNRPFDPPGIEVETDEGTEEIPVDAGAVERTADLAVQTLDDQTLAKGIAAGIIPTDMIAKRAPNTPRLPLAKATRRRIKLTQQALDLRASGHSVGEIAASMGIAPSTLTRYFAQFRRDLADGAIDDQLDQIAVPLATENLIHGLLAGDKDYTMETLKGRGVLRKGKDEGKGDGEIPALVIRVEHKGPTPSTTTVAVAPPRSHGHIVGTPAITTVEGDVVKADDT